MAIEEEVLKDFQTYPILAQEVNLASAPAASGPSTSLNRTVENLMRDVLGWRPKRSDPRGFVAALTQSFALEEVEGHVEWNYVPRGYAVQADLGALTGAQASIYQRAKAALGEMLPILDRLYPLNPVYDVQDVEAIRTIVRDGLGALVTELGMEGGPVVQKVDGIFLALIKIEPEQTPRSFEHPRGQLGLIQERFGLQRRRINTLEEERNYTDFLMLVDYVYSLWASWNSQRKYFDRIFRKEHDFAFFGPQLVLLSRQLAVIAESVQEAYYAMDSVFLGPAERQTTKLDLSGIEIELPVPTASSGERKGAAQETKALIKPTSPIYLSELLSWIDSVAGDTGPRLIQDAGKDGTGALADTLDVLRRLAHGAAAISGRRSANPSRGFHTPRVERTLEELADGLDEAFLLANTVGRSIPPEDPAEGLTTTVEPENPPSPLNPKTEPAEPPEVPGPSISNVELAERHADGPVFHVTGSGFQQDSEVWLIHVDSGTQVLGKVSHAQLPVSLTVHFNLSFVKPNGTWALKVINIDGKSGTKRDIYHHKPYDESTGSDDGAKQ